MRRRDSRRFYILFLLYGLCALFYYAGELVDFAGWEALRWNIFYTVHDIHRLFFLAPIVYAGYIFGTRAVAIITIITIGTWLPRALFISPFPDPLMRMLLFIVIEGAIGFLTARVRSDSRRLSYHKSLFKRKKIELSKILDNMTEGILIIGPDYKIRFMNKSMIEIFGEGTGSYCYEYIFKLEQPCHEICQLPKVINGTSVKCECSFPDDNIYQVSASPYIDSDEVVCQLTIFRSITKQNKGLELSNSVD